MLNRIRSLMILTVISFCWASLSFADVSAQNYLVLGVVASSKNQTGVALLKNAASGKTFAVKEGQAIDKDTSLASVGRKYIQVEVGGNRYQVEVGGDIASADVMRPSLNQPSYNQQSVIEDVASAVEVDGSTVKVSEGFKNQLVNVDLSKILMQAAAVPHMENGQLKGFQLWEIEKNSVFEVAGFRDGDIVTSINGQQIKDVGMAVRLLTSLKNVPEARFDYMRQGVEQNITVVVQ